MIRSITTKNFQKIGTAHFEFASGLNLIVGPNWTGKSTLMRAILFALGGGRALSIKTEDLITRGQTWLEVTLVLDTPQGPLEIVRGSKRIVATDLDTDQVIASGHPALAVLLEERLGLSAKDFQTFCVVQQGEPDALLRAGSAALATYIDHATGADLIDRAVIWLNSTKTRADGFVEGARGARDAAAAARETVLALEVQHVEQTANATSLRQQLAANNLSEWEAYLESLQQQEDAYRQVETERARLTQQRTENLARLEELGPETAAPSEEIEALRERLADLDRQDREQTRRLQEQVELTQRLERLRRSQQVDATARAATQKQRDDLEFYPEAAALLEEVQQRVAESKAETDNLRQIIQGSACPTCQRPFDTNLDIPSLRVEYAQASVRLQHDTSALLILRQQDSTNSASLIDKPRLEAALREFDQRAEAVRVELELGEAVQALPMEDFQPALQAVRTQIHQQNQALTAWQWQQSRRGLLTETRYAVEAQLVSLKEVPAVPSESLQQAVAAVQQLREMKQTVETALAVCGEQLRSIEVSLQTEQSKELALRDQVDLLVSMELRADSSGRLIKLLRKNRDGFLAEIWEQILSYASDFIRTASNGDMTALKRSEDGRFLYVEKDEVFPIEVASGMQTAILGVALKLALGAAIAGKAGLLLLDEVTAAGSDENSATFVGLLRGHAKQVVLVTHRQADAALADRVIEL